MVEYNSKPNYRPGIIDKAGRILCTIGTVVVPLYFAACTLFNNPEPTQTSNDPVAAEVTDTPFQPETPTIDTVVNTPSPEEPAEVIVPYGEAGEAVPVLGESTGGPYVRQDTSPSREYGPLLHSLPRNIILQVSWLDNDPVEKARVELYNISIYGEAFGSIEELGDFEVQNSQGRNYIVLGDEENPFEMDGFENRLVKVYAAGNDGGEKEINIWLSRDSYNENLDQLIRLPNEYHQFSLINYDYKWLIGGPLAQYLVDKEYLWQDVEILVDNGTSYKITWAEYLQRGKVTIGSGRNDISILFEDEIISSAFLNAGAGSTQPDATATPIPTNDDPPVCTPPLYEDPSCPSGCAHPITGCVVDP